MLFELWHGKREGSPGSRAEPSRKDYIADSKQHVEKMEAVFGVPFQEWGAQLLKRKA